MTAHAFFRWLLRFVAACCAIAALRAPCLAGQEQQSALQAALTQFAAHFDVIQHRMGSTSALDLQERLQSDLGAIAEDTPPAGFPIPDWSQRLRGLSALDASIVTQVIAGKPDPIAGSHGLVERLIVSRADGTLQPFALYVPSSPTADPSLVILLHGNPQTETEILAGPYFRTLADTSGTIVAAPYGRGIYDFAPPADDEVYQVTDEVASAFHIPARRIFLVGYSMGGFSVFKVGPRHPERWAAVMSIAGSVLGSDAESVHVAFQKTRMYVITGTKDESIPTNYPQSTAAYLASVGIPTGLYVTQGGTHWVATLMPQLSEAWHDMIGGTIRPGARPMGTPRLPMSLPPMGGMDLKS